MLSFVPLVPVPLATDAHDGCAVQPEAVGVSPPVVSTNMISRSPTAVPLGRPGAIVLLPPSTVPTARTCGEVGCASARLTTQSRSTAAAHPAHLCLGRHTRHSDHFTAQEESASYTHGEAAGVAVGQ